MIKYDWKCNRCKHNFTTESTYSESDKKPKCTKCKSKDVRKVIQVTSVHYKGSGFTKAISPED